MDKPIGPLTTREMELYYQAVISLHVYGHLSLQEAVESVAKELPFGILADDKECILRRHRQDVRRVLDPVLFSQPKRNKFGAVRVMLDGLHFDSKMEANRYQELRLLERAGKISNLQVHPRYRILGEYTDDDGKYHKPVIYEADFSYEENGRLVVEDVKGHETAVWKLKKKLFVQAYPDIDFRVLKK